MCVCEGGGGGWSKFFFYYESKFIKKFYFPCGGCEGGD